MKNTPATVRVATKLEEKGRQQAPDVTLGFILEIEIKVRDQGRLDISRVFDVFIIHIEIECF
jgi:hypothetical protein